MATLIPNSLKGRLVGDNAQISTAIDFEADTWKFMLLDSNHAIDIDADVFIDDVSANEVGNSGSYSAGGLAIVPVSTTDDSGNLGKVDAPDISATTATITAAFGILYKDTGTPGTSPIAVEYDFGGNIVSTAGTFSIAVNSAGLLTLA